MKLPSIKNQFVKGSLAGAFTYLFALCYFYFERSNNFKAAEKEAWRIKFEYSAKKQGLTDFIGDDSFRQAIYKEVFIEDSTETKYYFTTSVMGIEKTESISIQSVKYLDAIVQLIKIRESNYWVNDSTKKLLVNEIGYYTNAFVDELTSTFDADEACRHYFPNVQKLAHKPESERRDILRRIATSVYGNTSLSTGYMPWGYCYGRRNSCSGWGCSEIFVRAGNSDVVITVKNAEDKVVRHAYIRSNDTFTFKLDNGAYTTYFYYGKGWNPNKILKLSECGPVRGGFIANEQVEKDWNMIYNSILTYTLVESIGGTLHTLTSNTSEAL